MTNIKIDEKIINALKDNRLVVFAGAGVTKYLGMPDWKEFVINSFEMLSKKNVKYKSQIDRLKHDDCKPNEILNSIKDEKDRFEVKKSVSKIFKVPFAQDCWYHKKLLLLTPKIITTNFDDAFEIAYRQLFNGKAPTVAFNHKDIVNLNQVMNEPEFIFKIHGCTSSPWDCAIFEKDYKDVYKKSNNGVLSLLERFLRESVILFIGYSFKDDIIVNLIQNEHNKLGPLNYFVLTDDSKDDRDLQNKCSFLERIKIQYENVGTFLDALIIQKYKANEIKLSHTLSKTKLFSEIHYISILVKIVTEAEIKYYKKGDYLCKVGDSVHCFWLILKGKVKAIKIGTPDVIRSAGSPDSIVGEFGLLLGRHKRSSDLQVIENRTKVLKVNFDRINKLDYKEQLQLWKNFSKVLASKNEDIDFI